jgi:hypothetical protein
MYSFIKRNIFRKWNFSKEGYGRWGKERGISGKSARQKDLPASSEEILCTRTEHAETVHPFEVSYQPPQ